MDIMDKAGAKFLCDYIEAQLKKDNEKLDELMLNRELSDSVLMTAISGAFTKAEEAEDNLTMTLLSLLANVHQQLDQKIYNAMFSEVVYRTFGYDVIHQIKEQNRLKNLATDPC